MGHTGLDSRRMPEHELPIAGQRSVRRRSPSHYQAGGVTPSDHGSSSISASPCSPAVSSCSSTGHGRSNRKTVEAAQRQGQGPARLRLKFGLRLRSKVEAAAEPDHTRKPLSKPHAPVTVEEKTPKVAAAPVGQLQRPPSPVYIEDSPVLGPEATAEDEASMEPSVQPCQSQDEQSEHTEEDELFLSDIEGMLEEEQKDLRPGNDAAEVAPEQPGREDAPSCEPAPLEPAQLWTKPEPCGEIAELLAELGADPNEYWVAGTWDLEGLREDIELHRREQAAARGQDSVEASLHGDAADLGGGAHVGPPEAVPEPALGERGSEASLEDFENRSISDAEDMAVTETEDVESVDSDCNLEFEALVEAGSAAVAAASRLESRDRAEAQLCEATGSDEHNGRGSEQDTGLAPTPSCSSDYVQEHSDSEMSISRGSSNAGSQEIWPRASWSAQAGHVLGATAKAPSLARRGPYLVRRVQDDIFGEHGDSEPSSPPKRRWCHRTAGAAEEHAQLLEDALNFGEVETTSAGFESVLPRLALYLVGHPRALVTKNGRGSRTSGAARFFSERASEDTMADKVAHGCWACGKLDHESHDCTFKRCFVCSQTGHEHGECTRKRDWCERCNLHGHAQPQCPLEQYHKGLTNERDASTCRCIRCGAIGHVNCLYLSTRSNPRRSSCATALASCADAHAGDGTAAGLAQWLGLRPVRPAAAVQPHFGCENAGPLASCAQQGPMSPPASPPLVPVPLRFCGAGATAAAANGPASAEALRLRPPGRYTVEMPDWMRNAAAASHFTPAPKAAGGRPLAEVILRQDLQMPPWPFPRPVPRLGFSAFSPGPIASAISRAPLLLHSGLVPIRPRPPPPARSPGLEPGPG